MREIEYLPHEHRVCFRIWSQMYLTGLHIGINDDLSRMFIIPLVRKKHVNSRTNGKEENARDDYRYLYSHFQHGGDKIQMDNKRYGSTQRLYSDFGKAGVLRTPAFPKSARSSNFLVHPKVYTWNTKIMCHDNEMDSMGRNGSEKSTKSVASRSLLPVLLFGTLLGSFFGLASCKSTLNFAVTSTPHVIITAMLAEAHGQLIEKEGCLRLVANEQDPGHTLVWPADFMIQSENGQVKVTSGIVSGNRRETILTIGERVTLGGGEYVDEQLKKTILPNCSPPYWVVGSIMKQTPSTQSPE